MSDDEHDEAAAPDGAAPAARSAAPPPPALLLGGGALLLLLIVLAVVVSSWIAVAVPIPAAMLYLAGRAGRPQVEPPTVEELSTAAAFVAAAQDLMDAEAGQPAVLVVALDRFRDVETVLGDDRLVGVMEEVAQRVRATAGELPVADLSGERYAVAMMARPFLPAHHLARSLRDAIAQPLSVDGVELRLSSSVGLALGEGGASSLLRRASIAQEAASTGSEGVEVHRIEEPAVVRRRLDVASALTSAVENPEGHDLRPEFQPIVDPDGALMGAEALARWDDPALGGVSPGEFIPLAEQTGLVGPLFSVMLARALAGCASWRAAGLHATVSVNVSAINLRQPLLVSQITAALDAAGLHPQDVTLEVTETAVVADPELAERTLRELRSVGFRVALDDFGIGQSSLARLRELPVAVVKLDKAFIDPIPEDARSLAVVQATVDVCRALGLDIVAEGVERQEQADALTQMGIRKLQGFLFAPSMPVEGLIGTQRNPIRVDGPT